MNNKGIISTTLVYSFFIVFILFMIAIVMSLSNKVFLLKKVEQSTETVITDDPQNYSVCRTSIDSLATCMFMNEYLESGFNRDGVSSITDITNIKKSIENKGKPNYSLNSVNEEGMFAISDNSSSTSKSYYYRGAEDNNYITFAGKLWRIVRINGDGSIRIITDNSIESFPFNSEEKTLIRNEKKWLVGYKYGEHQDLFASIKELFDKIFKKDPELNKSFRNDNRSDILNYLNTFYENNLKSYESYISNDSIFYGDKEFATEDESKVIAGKLCQNFKFDLSYTFCEDISWTSWVLMKTIYYKGMLRALDYNNNNPSLNLNTSYCKYKYSGSTFDNEEYTESVDQCKNECPGLLDRTNCLVSCDKSWPVNNKDKNEASRNSCKNKCSGWNYWGCLIECDIDYPSNKIDQNSEKREGCKASCPEKFDINCSSNCEKSSSINSQDSNGIGYLKYPIGLITMDELMLSGMKFITSSNTSYRSNSFLINNVAGSPESFWTMTVGFLDDNITTDKDKNKIYEYIYGGAGKKGTYYFSGNNENGKIQVAVDDSSLGVRPVINLKKEVKYCSGNGTKDSPYQISNGSGGCVN